MKTLVALSLMLFIAGCTAGSQGTQYSFETGPSESGSPTRFACSAITTESREQWLSTMSASETQITRLLQAYVNVEEGSVAYSDWLANPDDRTEVKTILAKLSAERAQAATREQQMALFINFYNFATIDLILDRYADTLGKTESPRPGVRSILNIDNLEFGVWDTFKYQLGEESLTLNEIQKKKLVPMGDARIHFAINCASKGCPPLASTAFSAPVLEEQLDDSACHFVNNGRAGQTVFDGIDAQAPVIFTSQIMSWYAGDFENHQGGQFSDVRSFFARYLDESQTSATSSGLFRKKPDGSFLWDIQYEDYDWELNESTN